MMDTSFDNFVRREQQAVNIADEKPMDWQAEKNNWLEYLDELFAQVRGYLKPYVDEGQVVIDHHSIDLNEDNIGLYSVPEMIIIIGSKTIKLEPIGTFIIGSKGRVDVVGPVARAQLLLLNSEVRSMSQLIHVSVSMNSGPSLPPAPKSTSEVKWVWRIVTRPPEREILEVNKENFLSLLVEIANG